MAGEKQLHEKKQAAVLRSYSRLLKKAEALNPLLEENRQEAETKEKQSTQLSPRKLINRLQKKRDQIWLFMRDLSVPFDNNGSERDIRMVKLVQQTSGCLRTADGARKFCRLRSYLSTVRKQGHSRLSSLERAIVGKPLGFGPAAEARAAPS